MGKRKDGCPRCDHHILTKEWVDNDTYVRTCHHCGFVYTIGTLPTPLVLSEDEQQRLALWD